MKKIFTISLFCVSVAISFAQKETVDLTTFTPPNGWEKEVKANTYTSYSIINQQNKTYCQIFIMLSIASKGGIEEDFESEWQNLILNPYENVKEEPGNNEIKENDGWKIKKGAGKFTFNNNEGMFLITTMSGHNRCVSIVAITNSSTYLPAIETFLASVEMKIPSNDNSITETIITSVSNNKFTFSSSTFDDGWTSTVQEDWVEVTKGNIKVLLHYPKEGTIFPADPEPLTTAAWNILVAPRYSNLKNFKTSYITTHDRPYLGMGYATENSSGREMFIVLYRQGQDWLEVVTPDKNSFIQYYKFDPETIRWDSESDLLKPMAAMSSYNKFAVAASDFTGRWTSDFTGIQQLYHVYTGQYAGMNMNQSNEEFDFKAGNSYNWELLVVNGMVGTMKYNQVKSSGNFTVPNNWQVKFSMIENRARTYNAFWSCIKGARILNLLDADYPGSGIYTWYGIVK